LKKTDLSKLSKVKKHHRILKKTYLTFYLFFFLLWPQPMTATIALIGGWEIGRPGTHVETLSIDRHIKSLTNNPDPTFLFIPTASNDSEWYRTVVQEHFGLRVWYNYIQHLTLHLRDYSPQELIDLINRADVVYVGGGNTAMMMEKRNETGLADIFKQSYAQSGQTKIFCWLSAWSICRCASGVSDSLSFADPTNTSMIKVDALWLVPVIHSPHQIRESHRLYELMKMVEQSNQIWLSIDDSACVVIQNNNFSVIADETTPHAWAYKVRHDHGKINCQRLVAGEQWLSEQLYQQNHIKKILLIDDKEIVIW